MVKKGLGKGLGALIPGNLQKPVENNSSEESKGERVLFIPMNKIISNPNQPRKEFSKEKIAELAQSIKENGLIQPIIVRMVNGKFQIIAGERRFRAYSQLKLKEIEAIVKDMDDQQTSKIALIENIQRQDLNPIEEGMAYKKLIQEYGFKQAELGEILGKSRSAITNSLRILELPKEVAALITENKLTMGHGRALLGLEDPKKITTYAAEVVERDLNVRQTEELVKKAQKNKVIKEIFRNNNTNVEIERIKESLESIFSTKVELKGNEKKGKIEIEYYSLDDLNRILDVINKK